MGKHSSTSRRNIVQQLARNSNVLISKKSAFVLNLCECELILTLSFRAPDFSSPTLSRLQSQLRCTCLFSLKAAISLRFVTCILLSLSLLQYYWRQVRLFYNFMLMRVDSSPELVSPGLFVADTAAASYKWSQEHVFVGLECNLTSFRLRGFYTQDGWLECYLTSFHLLWIL